MKKIINRGLIGIIVLIVVLIIIYWGQVEGALRVYHLIGAITTQIEQGNDDLNFRLDADWGRTADTRDSLVAVIYYQKDERFIADFKYDQNRYIIKSSQILTEVDILKSGLRISAEGRERVNFDVLLLLKEIMQNHPSLEPVLSMGFLKRLGISLWAFSSCNFTEDDTFEIISIPRDVIGAEIDFWIDEDTGEDVRIVVRDSVNSMNAKLKINSFTAPYRSSDFHPEHQLNVKRTELNTAIYRGTVRAAGILIENAIKPAIDTSDRTWGKGRLTFVDGNRVLIAKGSHTEIGEAHGALLTKEIRKMIDATLYTVGWVYTIGKKKWFIDEMRGAYNRLEAFIPAKYQEEMAALSKTSGFPLEEIRLTNVFPALFHCSGFALFNDATINGQLLHGRVLDYMTGIGLQYHAVVFILKPIGSYAFANIGYAGFIGSVSGMNDQKVAFGEMGGRGEGDWDGMPMAFLMRAGMEQTSTLDEALTLFRDTPRTCEYFYVISDGKIPDARGLATTPSLFEVIEPNQLHEKLPHPVKDAVLMSAGDRYEKIVERVKHNYGKYDEEKAIRLMDRPVAMKSNLHNVLFAPQTLEFWVANAGANTPAANEPYTHYSLEKLLDLAE
jgi:hypothetical protein